MSGAAQPLPPRWALVKARIKQLAADGAFSFEENFKTTEQLIRKSMESIKWLLSVQGEEKMLTFFGYQSCDFLRKIEKGFSSSAVHQGPNVSSRIVETRTTYEWKITVSYSFDTVDDEKREIFYLSSTKATPLKKRVWDDMTLPISWLCIPFSIDRDQPSCRTFVRNENVQEVIQNFEKLIVWCTDCIDIFDIWARFEQIDIGMFECLAVETDQKEIEKGNFAQVLFLHKLMLLSKNKSHLERGKVENCCLLLFWVCFIFCFKQ